MILFFITLAYLAFWSPSWRTLAILAVIITVVSAGVLAWVAGLFNVGVDYDSPQAVSVYGAIARAVGLNTLVYLVIGVLIVYFGKRRREADARELELLARLTKPSADT